MNWANFLKLFQDSLGLTTFLSTVLWFIYVTYTIKTFNQIRKQTDLQSDAFLVTRAAVEDDLEQLASTKEDRRGLTAFLGLLNKRPSTEYISDRSERLRSKWAEILSRNLPPSVITQPRGLILRLKNHGKTDVISWTIDFSLQVEPSEFLKKQANTTGEQIEWRVQGTDVIEAGDALAFVVLKTGSYPKANLSWRLAYEDARGKQYSRFGGESTFEFSNEFASPSATPPAPTGDAPPIAQKT